MLAGFAAHAHGVRSDVSLTLQASADPAVVVQLHQGDIAPQLVIENRSGKRLEILDTHGRIFLRLDKDGVEADTASADWRAVLNPLGTISTPARTAPSQWKKIRKEPSYGWFDLRLNSEPVNVPREFVLLGKSAPLQDWVIPARLDGKPYEIRGQFIYQPPPRGHVQTLLRSSSEWRPGIQLQLAGGRTPALFLRNDSQQTVQVLGANNKPLHTIKPGQRKSWVEPRAAYGGALPADAAQARALGTWRVPVRIGTQAFDIHGVHQWVPAPKTAK